VRRVGDAALNDLLQRVDALALGIERVHEMHSALALATALSPSRASPSRLLLLFPPTPSFHRKLLSRDALTWRVGKRTCTCAVGEDVMSNVDCKLKLLFGGGPQISSARELHPRFEILAPGYRHVTC
jgi:hypothetical protein